MRAEDILDILGNESRRKILQLLSRRPCYVSEISYCLRMAPKAVIEHLSKLERMGLVESVTDVNRRKYYYISRNIRLEIDLSPHLFRVDSPSSGISLDEYSFAREIMNLFEKTVDSKDNFRGIAETLETLRKAQRTLSSLQMALMERINESFNALVELAGRVMDDNLEKIILISVAKSPSDPEAISEELGLSINEVRTVLENLEKKGLVRKIEREKKIIYSIL